MQLFCSELNGNPIPSWRKITSEEGGKKAFNSGHNVLPATPKGSARTLLGPNRKRKIWVTVYLFADSHQDLCRKSPSVIGQEFTVCELSKLCIWELPCDISLLDCTSLLICSKSRIVCISVIWLILFYPRCSLCAHFTQLCCDFQIAQPIGWAISTNGLSVCVSVCDHFRALWLVSMTSLRGCNWESCKLDPTWDMSKPLI